MSDEHTELEKDTDRYADYEVLKQHVCESCPLPRTLVTYERWFTVLQEQLTILREDMQKVMNRVDVIYHDHRDLPRE